MTEEAIKLKYELFKDRLGPWGPKLKPFIESEEMMKIYDKIREDGEYERIVPSSKDTYRAFATTNPDTLKVIFYLMDPYPKRYKAGLYQATGIAMDCSNSPNGKIQPSLKIFYDGISKDIGKKIEHSPSLEYLHEQGVMMLNTDLTCKLYKTGSHEGVWEPFQKYILEEVLGSSTNIIYVLSGKSSKRMERYINPFCRIFKIEHPMAAGRTHSEWEYNNVFNKINRILKDNNEREIFWDRRDWEAYKTPPF